MTRHSRVQKNHGFTLTELLIVTGLIAMIGSLLLPAIGKARAASQATACLSNLRQMSTAWTMYTAASRGRLIDLVNQTPATPEVAWYGYWPGVLDSYGVRDGVLTCPNAAEPPSDGASQGYGSAHAAWTGKFGVANGSAIRFNAQTTRDGSYGFNAYLTTTRGFAASPKVFQITGIKNLCDVPLFMDCVYIDTEPDNGRRVLPASPPPNLLGDQVTATSPQHWRFLLSRHGRAINMSMADGSARRVPLEETYMLTWHASWEPYPIPLPSR